MGKKQTNGWHYIRFFYFPLIEKIIFLGVVCFLQNSFESRKRKFNDVFLSVLPLMSSSIIIDFFSAQILRHFFFTWAQASKIKTSR